MKYILAISGGVDSRVLLDLAARSREFRATHFPDSEFPRDFVAAHFDHGVRENSSDDAEFVKNLADKYQIEFVLGRENLGQNASEETARRKRYEFLRDVACDKKEDSYKIVTAHHADDLFETIVINLIRGTGWRGLSPMSDEQILRPLLNLTKAEIIEYAIEHDLIWVEDSTNLSPHYLRNRVRDLTANFPTQKRRELLKLYERQRILRFEIEEEIAKIFNCFDIRRSELVPEFNNLKLDHQNKFDDDKVTIPRHFLIMIPEIAATEILHAATNGELTRPQLARVLLFIKTAAPRKIMNFKNLRIEVTKTEIKFSRNRINPMK